MKFPVPKGEPISNQPPEFVDEVAGVYFRSIMLAEAGQAVEQHVHDYDHATLVCCGRARMWIDNVYAGEVEPGRPVEIKAGQRHMFQALEANTRLVCVHNAESALAIKERGL